MTTPCCANTSERDSEEAFAALVARHVNKVYSVALRHTRNPHQPRKSPRPSSSFWQGNPGSLGKHVILSGWLYQTARLTAVTFIRGEIRRARREQEAHMQTVVERKRIRGLDANRAAAGRGHGRLE